MQVDFRLEINPIQQFQTCDQGRRLGNVLFNN